MVQYIKIVNWEKYQHYTKRRPPWIKLYRDLLRDRGFSALPDAARYHAVGLLLLAAYHDNRIPFDVSYIRRELNAKSRIDFTRLFDSGMIELCGQEPIVIPETEKRREETETKYQTPEKTRGPLPFAVSHYSRVVFDILAIKQILQQAGIKHPRHLDRLAHQANTTADRFTGMLIQVIAYPSRGQPKRVKSFIAYTTKIFTKDNGKVLASDSALDFVRGQIKDYENQGKQPPAAICHKCALDLEEAEKPDDWYWDDQIGWLCPACDPKPEAENAW